MAGFGVQRSASGLGLSLLLGLAFCNSALLLGSRGKESTMSVVAPVTFQDLQRECLSQKAQQRSRGPLVDPVTIPEAIAAVQKNEVHLNYGGRWARSPK